MLALDQNAVVNIEHKASDLKPLQPSVFNPVASKTQRDEVRQALPDLPRQLHPMNSHHDQNGCVESWKTKTIRRRRRSVVLPTADYYPSLLLCSLTPLLLLPLQLLLLSLAINTLTPTPTPTPAPTCTVVLRPVRPPDAHACLLRSYRLPCLCRLLLLLLLPPSPKSA